MACRPTACYTKHLNECHHKAPKELGSIHHCRVVLSRLSLSLCRLLLWLFPLSDFLSLNLRQELLLQQGQSHQLPPLMLPLSHLKLQSLWSLQRLLQRLLRHHRHHRRRRHLQLKGQGQRLLVQELVQRPVVAWKLAAVVSVQPQVPVQPPVLVQARLQVLVQLQLLVVARLSEPVLQHPNLLASSTHCRLVSVCRAYLRERMLPDLGLSVVWRAAV